MLESISPGNRRHRALSVATFGSEAFFAFPIVFIIGFVLTRLSSLLLVIAVEVLDSGVTARSHITNRWSAHGRQKVPNRYSGARRRSAQTLDPASRVHEVL